MNSRQIELVQESWARVAPRADEAARLFYANLFALAPQVRDEHYAIVGKALIETLREALGEAFGAEVEQAWASAYAALAGAMLRPEARRAA
jgi:nitric oxide dioxygenase